MPKQYNYLRTLAFQVAPDVTTLAYRCEEMSFPEQWKDLLTGLAKEATNRTGKPATMPIDSLNRALLALAPDLVHIASSAHRPGERPWLYSGRPLDAQALFPIVHAWIHTAFARASDDSRRQVLQKLQANALQWTSRTLDLIDWRASHNGTAEPAHNDAFVILPHYLATLISEQNASFEIGNEQRSFRRAPRRIGQNGAELITWPPLMYEDQWPYSIALTLTVQTVPFQAYPVIYCDLGIRRWAGPSPFMRGGQTSVYLLTETPWLHGFQHTHSFQVAPLAWQKNAEERVDCPFRIVWGKGGELSTILDHLSSHREQGFPDPRAIVDDPLQALNVGSSPSVALVYRHGMKPQHKVGSGLPPADRRSLAMQLTDFLAPTLQLTAPLERIPIPRTRNQRFKTQNFFFPATADKQNEAEMVRIIAQRRAAISRVCNGCLTLEIRYQESIFAKTLVRVIGEILDMSIDVGQTCTTPELALTVIADHLGASGDELDVRAGRKAQKDRHLDALHDRIAMIQTERTPTTAATITLIELANTFEEERDPKAALRLGFARTGRLTQFFDSSDEKLEDRARNGFLDGLRQLGVTVDLPHVKGLPSQLNVTGVWLIQQNAPTNLVQGKTLLPVAVNVSLETDEIRATAPGLFEDTGWLLYPDLLKAIAEGRAKSVEKPYQALPFVEQVVEDVTSEGDTLLLCHAQNFRRVWPWLGNGKMLSDTLIFDGETAQPISRWPGLRVVRIRDNQRNETPEWYAERPDEEAIGFTQGLFRMGERVFASTHQPPRSFSHAPRNISKMMEWESNAGTSYDPDPEYYAWNPGLFEVTVAALQKDDKPDMWATLVHKLRHAALQYDSATALPLPLHLARAIREYVLLTDDTEDDG